MPLLPGSRLAAYEIVSPLGAGGMGEVYKARDTRLDRIVAIKVLPAAVAGDAAFHERFDREARAISQLAHPHICTLYDVGDDNGVAFLVMEFVDGETLADRLRRGPPPLDEALAVAVQIAGALRAAHAAGIVHRDLKPGNVMLARPATGAASAPYAKLLDFGLAKTSAGDNAAGALSMLPTTPANLTAQGVILGTLQYMSPEQLEGKDVDARSDVFAFGVLLYELTTGVHPFAGSSAASTIAAIIGAEPAPLAQRNPRLPAELDRIVRKCLRKRKDERYQSTADLAVDLAGAGRAAAPIAAADDEDSLFAGLRRAVPSVRRWWEMLLIAWMTGYVVALWPAWWVRQSATVSNGWENAWLVAFLVATASLMFIRMSLLLRAVVNPRMLPPRVAQFSVPLRLFTMLYGGVVAAAALLLGFNRYPLTSATAVTAGIAFVFIALVVEPANERIVFPPVEAAVPARRTAPAMWWWAHYLAALVLTTPVVAFLLWEARTSVSESLRQPLFLFNVFALAIQWTARFALVSAMIGNPQDAANQMVRLRGWIRWTGWLVIAGLAATSLLIASRADILTALLAVMAMGGVACIEFIDPAVERAAFPSQGAPAGQMNR